MHKPQWSGEIEGYVTNYLKKNQWRVAHTMEWDDSMQEARCLFLKMEARYHVEEAKHFMALFKTALSRRFTDLSVADTEFRKTVYGEADDELPASDGLGEVSNAGELATMLRQAPNEVTMVVSLFFNAPQELLDIVLYRWQADREGANWLINRALGLRKRRPTLEQVADYFSPG